MCVSLRAYRSFKIDKRKKKSVVYNGYQQDNLSYLCQVPFFYVCASLRESAGSAPDHCNEANIKASHTNALASHCV